MPSERLVWLEESARMEADQYMEILHAKSKRMLEEHRAGEAEKLELERPRRRRRAAAKVAICVPLYAALLFNAFIGPFALEAWSMILCFATSSHVMGAIFNGVRTLREKS